MLSALWGDPERDSETDRADANGALHPRKAVTEEAITLIRCRDYHMAVPWNSIMTGICHV